MRRASLLLPLVLLAVAPAADARPEDWRSIPIRPCDPAKPLADPGFVCLAPGTAYTGTMRRNEGGDQPHVERLRFAGRAGQCVRVSVESRALSRMHPVWNRLRSDVPGAEMPNPTVSSDRFKPTVWREWMLLADATYESKLWAKIPAYTARVQVRTAGDGIAEPPCGPEGATLAARALRATPATVADMEAWGAYATMAEGDGWWRERSGAFWFFSWVEIGRALAIEFYDAKGQKTGTTTMRLRDGNLSEDGAPGARPVTSRSKRHLVVGRIRIELDPTLRTATVTSAIEPPTAYSLTASSYSEFEDVTGGGADGSGW